MCSTYNRESQIVIRFALRSAGFKVFAHFTIFQLAPMLQFQSAIFFFLAHRQNI